MNLFKRRKQNTADGSSGADFSLDSMTARDTEALYQKGIATFRDLIAPPAVRLSPNVIQVGDVFVRTYFVIAYPRYLSTNWFSPIINLDFPWILPFLFIQLIRRIS